MLYAKRVRMGEHQLNISLITDKPFHPFTGFIGISICGFFIVIYDCPLHEKCIRKHMWLPVVNVHMPENYKTRTCISSKGTKIRNCNFWK